MRVKCLTASAILALKAVHYEYAEIVSNIRRVFDNPSVTTDVMVGFAGETEEEFLRSAQFVEETGFARTHIFPYSRRPGTAADRAPDQVPESIKKKRAAIMAEYAERARKRFLEAQLGRIEKVLLEARNKNGLYEGYTPNYTQVFVEADESLVNKVVDVELKTIEGDHIIGELKNT